MYSNLIRNGFILVGILLIRVWENGADEADVVEDEKVTKLININSFSKYCDDNICRGFNFPDVTEVAFFSLKTEVHIAPDAVTYDIDEKPAELEALIIKDSTFRHFPLNLFYSIRMKELDIRNCSIEHVTWENFLMADKLRLLLLSHNRLERIDELTFNYASELNYLFLDSNRINELVRDSFKGLKKLRYLDMSHNRLTVLPVGVFDDLTELRELLLNENRLRTIQNKHFAFNAKLHSVILTSNRLREIEDDAFRAQHNLTFVDLSHNEPLTTLIVGGGLQLNYLTAVNCSLSRVNIYANVTNVDLSRNHLNELYFSEPELLETLVLRQTSLTQISSLTRATRLVMLDLADNPDLGELPDPWGADSLERLNLSNTSLSALPVSSLATLVRLNNLNVSNNNLREINPGNFMYLKKLTHFFIHANDWNCYNLNMIMDFLIRPLGITYTVDPFNPEFPGEYINGIACMYRDAIFDDSRDESPASSSALLTNNLPGEYTTQTTAAEATQQLKTDPAMEKVRELRKELKAIVSFYEQKFARAFEMIENLNAKLGSLEALNSSMWQHVTITA